MTMAPPLPYDLLFDLSRVLEEADYQVRHDRLPGLKTVIARIRDGIGFEMEPGSQAAYEAALRKNLEKAIPGTAAGKALADRREQIERLRRQVADLRAQIDRYGWDPDPSVTICPGMSYLKDVLAASLDVPDGHIVRVPDVTDLVRDRSEPDGWRDRLLPPA